ncbi:YlxR family protein [Kribbella caucasensis]|uniref:YlxR family protein n=1 Tax=Kribbella caucasensis TaxID=2512215 RepID=UPI0021077EFE|nr:YlxR family protein [Kribbella sp. VKM Ac-2527]
MDARPGKVRERTCIGCRKRDSPSGLLRMTVSERQVLPDPEHRAPGRGAHLHPVTECLDLAERRKAFPRAFKVQGPLDAAAVRNWIEGSGAEQRSSAIGKESAATRPPAAVEGSSRRHEGGSSTHDHSMSVER